MGKCKSGAEANPIKKLRLNRTKLALDFITSI